MNVYDHAHGLARALKDSDEYKNYVRLKNEVSEIEGINEMLADFQQKQFEMQAAQMTGQDVAPEMTTQIQELYQIIMRDPKAMEYMQAEMMFSQIISDIYRILGEVIQVDGK